MEDESIKQHEFKENLISRNKRSLSLTSEDLTLCQCSCSLTANTKYTMRTSLKFRLWTVITAKCFVSSGGLVYIFSWNEVLVSKAVCLWVIQGKPNYFRYKTSHNDNVGVRYTMWVGQDLVQPGRRCHVWLDNYISRRLDQTLTVSPCTVYCPRYPPPTPP